MYRARHVFVTTPHCELTNPDQDLCIAQGHIVDCILKPLRMYESTSQQGFHNMGRDAEVLDPTQKSYAVEIHC